jgi:hypothetical protein
VVTGGGAESVGERNTAPPQGRLAGCSCKGSVGQVPGFSQDGVFGCSLCLMRSVEKTLVLDIC